MKNVVLAKKNHLKVSLAWHYFAQSHKTSWKKSIFEKNKIMPQAGFEPTSSWLLEWSLSEFCHEDSCFPGMEFRIYNNVQWWASFNLCHQVTTVLLHCVMASWILPKNERWGNFQYIKLPQRLCFGRIQDNIFFFRDFLTFGTSRI